MPSQGNPLQVAYPSISLPNHTVSLVPARVQLAQTGDSAFWVKHGLERHFEHCVCVCACVYTMVLYAVFYSRKRPRLSLGVLWELYLAFMGPVVHVELVFVKDLQCDCLNITMKHKDGHPSLERNRPYHEVLTDDCPYKLEWVRIPVDSAREPQIRLFVERLVQSKKYQMCEREMLASILPGQLRSAFTRLYTVATGVVYTMPARTAEGGGGLPGSTAPIPQFCTGLSLVVLREACGYTDLPQSCTASELRHRLVNVKKMETLQSPYRQYRPAPTCDAANIKRARNTLFLFNQIENRWDRVTRSIDDTVVRYDWGFAA